MLMTKDPQEYLKLKKLGKDIHLVDDNDFNRQYPVNTIVSFIDWNNGYEVDQVTFYSLEDERKYYNKITNNGKLISINYETSNSK